MDQEEIKERVEKIEKIYAAYLDKLLELKKEQDKIIADFEEVLVDNQIWRWEKSLLVCGFPHIMCGTGGQIKALRRLGGGRCRGGLTCRKGSGGQCRVSLPPGCGSSCTRAGSAG